ncbi:hypothetical protein M446_0764 [Methylobacterium sp. 4-46]|uniref:hypothetical protein n=1 Tax=unclassified Methylobacterium TaxID=2615210 RepID=UPI000165C7C1|nr:MULTISPECIES: hypothetical protein [Methylobacterium]ACA15319.1 hypothetical protein M446_0764 [Methylobacterium sp. 4-46]WFT81045.1 cupin [Methylobacterium nodulans]
MSFACTVPATPVLQPDDETARIARRDVPPGASIGRHAHGQSCRRLAGIYNDVRDGFVHPTAFEIASKHPEALANPR